MQELDPDFTFSLKAKAFGRTARECGGLFHPSNGHRPRKKHNMRKIQVLLPEEMIAYLQSIVESGETESMSQTIRKIIMKEMKANETQ